MLQFSEKISAIIADGKGESLFFVKITNGDSTLYRASTTHYTSFTTDDGTLYEADDFIVSVDAPQLSSTVDREQYKITLADPEFVLAAEAENGLVGKTLEAHLAFIDPETNLPLLDEVDTFVVYKGKIDGAAASINTEEMGDSSFVISGASPMMALDMSKGFYFSRDAIRSKNPDDGCCDAVYSGSGTVALKWGKT